ncbi:acetyl esterase/lipase [Wenyingzhuangia heitensis]|uniref:Acetyl esterase/lipase n=1 Tax=Wenyingzhuangia heitensis TaxID=1487859 RepID=A0ABX0UBV4_9FLAO|nr:alpha/beta hydrolase [Wenyingzhuangia heitensis]NIJ44641.1 acetyl esterase/lipase [Wenyingzhuangia heitensis]
MFKPTILSFIFFCTLSLFAQKVETLKLPFTKANDVTWTGKEHHYFSKNWNSDVITNVSEPSIDIYHPKKELRNGTAIIIAPGGALYALSMLNEGKKVAEWLTSKGITAVVLKYRLVPSESNDAIEDYKKLRKQTPEKIQNHVNKVIPYAIQDGLTAISYLRKHTTNYGINPNKIGFMGFSAGGAVTMGVAYNYTQKNRPNFLVPVYPWTAKYPVQKPQKDSPPIFIVCASNDPLQLAMGSVHIYKSWKELDLNAELHMYAKGGHGFGMKSLELPSDTWIERFYDWGVNEKLITLKK